MGLFSLAEFKVGALIVGIGGLIAFMSMQVSDDPSYMGRSKKAWFLLPNASGLIKGSAIRSAGIPIGAIHDIVLQDGKARIDITVKSEVALTRSATVEMKSNGILGDKHVEVFPGTAGDPALEDGGQILNVKDGGSMDDVMTQVGELAGSLKEVAKTLQEAVSQDGSDKHILGRIVQNIEILTGDLAEMTTDNKQQVGEIVAQVHDITSTLDELVNDESDKGFKKTWKNAMVRIDSSLKNIDDITSKINRGEGTIGKLISDEQTSEDVSSAIEGISGLVDSANKISTGLDFNSYYLTKVGAAKTAVGVTIQPGLDRFYYLGIITDPAGVVDVTNTKVTPAGGATQETDTVVTYKSKTKITALFGKNFFNWTLRGGLIEDKGGIGIDYHTLNSKLTASVDAYDFEQLQIRTALNYKMFYGFYLTAGYNDLLHKKESQSAYAGAGLFLTNDDLKLLLSKSPF